MPHEEKRAWIGLVVALVVYGGYVVLILGKADGEPLTEVAYQSTMLWMIGLGIVATILLDIIARVTGPEHAARKDVRDREIYQLGERVGQSFLVIGAFAGLGMAMAQWDYFWIANVLCLAFFLSAVLSAVTQIFAYRRGF